MTQAEEVEFSVETLSRIHRQEARRFETGVMLRALVHKQLGLGHEPEHYRVEWLRRGVNEIINVLERLGHEFDRAHPNDKSSANDLLDILESTQSTVRDRCSTEN